MGENPLLPNSSEMAWNFQMPFYRKESGTLWMVYVNLHKSICPRVFSMTIYYFRIQKVDPLVAEQNWQRGEDVEENSWGGVNSSKMARYFLKPIMQGGSWLCQTCIVFFCF